MWDHRQHESMGDASDTPDPWGPVRAPRAVGDNRIVTGPGRLALERRTYVKNRRVRLERYDGSSDRRE
jgi:hypothetical protein